MRMRRGFGGGLLVALSGVLLGAAEAKAQSEPPARDPARETPAASADPPRALQGQHSAPSPEPAASPPQRQQVARELYLRGSAHVEAGEWELAISAYSEALTHYRSASILINLAYCHQKLGDTLSAWISLTRALSMSSVGIGAKLAEERRTAAEEELFRLGRMLSLLNVPEDGELTVSGTMIEPLPERPGVFVARAAREGSNWTRVPAGGQVVILPGRYRIRQRSPAAMSERAPTVTTREVLLAAGESIPLGRRKPISPAPPGGSAANGSPPASADLPRLVTVVPPTPAGPARPGAPEPTADASIRHPYRSWAIASLTVGGAGLLGALVTAGFLIDADSTLSQECTGDGTCPPELAGTVDRYESAAVVTNVGLAVGIAASTLGLGLLLLDRQHQDNRVSVEAAGSAVRLKMAF